MTSFESAQTGLLRVLRRTRQTRTPGPRRLSDPCTGTQLLPVVAVNIRSGPRDPPVRLVLSSDVGYQLTCVQRNERYESKT